MRFIRNTRCIGTVLALTTSACQVSLPEDEEKDPQFDRKDNDADDDNDDEGQDSDSDSDSDGDSDSDSDGPGGQGGKGGNKDGNGGNGGNGGNNGKDSTAGPFEPPEPVLRALLGAQYKASIRDVLGANAAAKASPPPDPNAINGFHSIGASQLSIDANSVEKYEASARAVAAAAAADQKSIDALAGCKPNKSNSKCLDQFVEQAGYRLFRRPINQVEKARYLKVAQDGSHYQKAESVLAAMLQSPYFLYQVEIGGKAQKGEDKRPLTGYELATRLSFFLLGTTPSEALLAAAKDGELDTPEGIRSVANEMLEDPAARRALNEFWYEMLDLGHVTADSKDPDVFAMWNDAMASSARKETLTFLDKIIWEGSGSFKEIWTAEYTYANRDVARLYGMGTKGRNNDFVKVDLPADSKRAGLLGQASFLSSVSHSTTTSPTLRGKHVMEKFLCVVIPAPPPEAVSEFNPTSGKAKTKEELLKEHVTNPSCEACHKFMDPIGLALENFDAIGRFRFEENGVELNTEHDAFSLGTVDGAAEIGALIAEDKRSASCFARNLFRFATGHIETEGEEGSIQEMVSSFRESKFDVPTLLVEIVASPAFRYVGKINE